MLPYSLGQDWYPSAVAWWDVEFWNASVDRAYRIDGTITYTPEPFPSPNVRVDPDTGAIAGFGGADHVVRSALDARLGVFGAVVGSAPGLELVELTMPARAQWMTRGLDPDGWTRRDRRAVLRVYPPAGTTALRVSVTAPPVEESRSVQVGPVTISLVANETRDITFDVCVPDAGNVEVPIDVEGSSSVREVPFTPPYSERFRDVGVRVVRIEAVPTGGSCPP
jgi:hypothetical protein